MKKQFFRVKQLADQTFSRAGKTEALSDELQEAEKRVEFIKAVCLSSTKKLYTTTHDTQAKDKRLKKNPEYNLGMSMIETASTEEDNVLSQVVMHCGKLQICLANAEVDHEMKVEAGIVAPLTSVSEHDHPNIMKQKRTLTKLILDMDSLKQRYNTASKHSNSTPGLKIKEELEEAEIKVEQARESLACEMLQLVGREAELSRVILDYARLQMNYHNTAIAILNEIIPEMESSIKESRGGPVFGRALEEHLENTQRRIAYPIELCVCGLLELGTSEEGIFRVTPGASKVRRMKVSLDANLMTFERALEWRDPHMFAGVLKLYLRELPEPLLTSQLYHSWIHAARLLYSGDVREGQAEVAAVLRCLPEANYDNLEYIIKFLSTLASTKSTHKMSPQNLAIVIAPNLIWNTADDNNIGMNMNAANLHSVLVENLVSHCDHFFSGDVEFYVTLSREVGLLNGHSTETLETDMKRTQSNSSLSDHNSSPPAGSPKPAVRARKHKPAAPNPPSGGEKGDRAGERRDRGSSGGERGDRGSSGGERGDMGSSGGERGDKRSSGGERRDRGSSGGEKGDLGSNGGERGDKGGSGNERGERADRGSSSGDGGSSGGVDRGSSGGVDRGSSGGVDRGSSGGVDRGGGGGLDVVSVAEREGRSPPPPGPPHPHPLQSPGGKKMVDEAGSGVRTLERKKRPTPAPRPSLLEGGEKPAIPQRPASLQRPHSSSFRLHRTFEPEGGSGEGRSLERTHIYSVDKQQVSFVSAESKGDRRGGEAGHQRAASEGSIIDTVMQTCGQQRAGRPTPPPPPSKESTNL